LPSALELPQRERCIARSFQGLQGMSNAKTTSGNFFEDFRLGQKIAHATPRTITAGDVALYTGLYGGRFAVQSADTFAQSLGYPRAPVDDLLVFHIVFGKTVPDISLNAVANLGYADCRFLAPAYTGDTLIADSEVVGLKENSNRETGVVYVRSTGRNQRGDIVLSYLRWVMVRKRAKDAAVETTHVPHLPAYVDPSRLDAALPNMNCANWDASRSGSRFSWDDYTAGERIDHVDGTTIEEAEHQIATRLYQNTAKVHFNHHTEAKGRFGRRLVYGGVIISMARALSFNGLGSAFHIAAINSGRHVAPAFAGDTVYASSEILDTHAFADRTDIGALRVRTLALKNDAGQDFIWPGAKSEYSDGTLLDLDYWVVLPRKKLN
jgi:2-methylfumaryl-CoA hydratase